MIKPRFQDAHLHLQDPRLSGNLEQLIDETRATGVTRLVVNGTSPDDWKNVGTLAEKFPDLVIPSYGLHPWKTPTPFSDWKGQLTTLVESNPLACIGECGLDLWMDSPDMEAQEDAFRFQLELAARLNRPLSIHLLKAWGWALDILENSKLPERGFLLHSFGGSKEIAQRFNKLGAYFSFSGYFLQQRKVKVQHAFQAMPREKILLETDAPDMLPPESFITHPLDKKCNHPANLVSIGNGLSELLGLQKEALAAQLEQNFQRFFVQK